MSLRFLRDQPKTEKVKQLFEERFPLPYVLYEIKYCIIQHIPDLICVCKLFVVGFISVGLMLDAQIDNENDIHNLEVLGVCWVIYRLNMESHGTSLESWLLNIIIELVLGSLGSLPIFINRCLEDVKHRSAIFWLVNVSNWVSKVRKCKKYIFQNLFLDNSVSQT